MLELGELGPFPSVLQALDNSRHPRYFNFPVCNQDVSAFSCSFRPKYYTSPLLKNHRIAVVPCSGLRMRRSEILSFNEAALITVNVLVFFLNIIVMHRNTLSG